MNQGIACAEIARPLLESSFWDRKAWDILSCPSLARHFNGSQECWVSLAGTSGMSASRAGTFAEKRAEEPSPVKT